MLCTPSTQPGHTVDTLSTHRRHIADRYTFCYRRTVSPHRHTHTHTMHTVRTHQQHAIDCQCTLCTPTTHRRHTVDTPSIYRRQVLSTCCLRTLLLRRAVGPHCRPATHTIGTLFNAPSAHRQHTVDTPSTHRRYTVNI